MLLKEEASLCFLWTLGANLKAGGRQVTIGKSALVDVIGSEQKIRDNFS
jgi:hypothetical protein